MTADPDAFKKHAAAALRKSGRAYLTELGLKPASSSPRQWIGDYGWWLINVEFQASNWSASTYLNIGIQYLWTIRDSRVFGHGPVRQSIPGHGQSAGLNGDDEQIRANADAVAKAARTAVEKERKLRDDDQAHLHLLANSQNVDAWDGFDACVAAGLLGQTSRASSGFEAIKRTLDQSVAWQADLASDCERLRHITADQRALRLEILDRIAETRHRLRLPAVSGLLDATSRI
ncbi:MAG: hypothetical protein LLG14_08350 [Nocardiaceae bacterium]|nr:hypothetical protein [Nocardiaceae bacterium]